MLKCSGAQWWDVIGGDHDVGVNPIFIHYMKNIMLFAYLMRIGLLHWHYFSGFTEHGQIIVIFLYALSISLLFSFVIICWLWTSVWGRGPWFWGSVRLFITTWFPELDPNSLSITRVPIWVHLYNLPLNLWYLLFLRY